MLEGKLWQASRQRIDKIHQWRPRRSRVGELVQWDTSEHAWFFVHDDDPRPVPSPPAKPRSSTSRVSFTQDGLRILPDAKE
jgi:hypothetical protein